MFNYFCYWFDIAKRELLGEWCETLEEAIKIFNKHKGTAKIIDKDGHNIKIS